MPNQPNNEMLYRTFGLKKRDIDEEKRTVPLAFSSEEPFERWFGMEILSHDSAHVRMDRLNNKAPLLKDHWRDEQIGVVESAWIDKDKKGRAVVRFSKSQKGEEEFQDVLDGIRTKVSVGYIIHEKTLISEKEGMETYLVNDWEPMEISLVSIPADEKVGVGREAGKRTQTITIIRKEGSMPEENTPESGKKETPVFTPDDIRKANEDGKFKAEKAFKERMAQRDADTNEIISLGERFQMKDEALKAIREGVSLDDFRNQVMDAVERRNAKPPAQKPNDIGMSEREKNQYSFIRALRAACFGGKYPQYIKEAGLEIEAGEAARKLQPNGVAKGLVIPHDMLGHRYDSESPMIRAMAHMAQSVAMMRTLTAGTATDGAELVADNLLAGSFIDVLRNLAIVMSLGARTMTGLVGDVLIPRKTSGASAGWISTEGGDAANSEAQFDQVSMSPKTGGVYTDLSRQLLMQSTPSAEALIRDDLAQAMILLIDLAGLYGTGSSGQPTGIANTTGINAPTSFAGAVPTWAEVVAMESAVAVDNALQGTLGYAIEPAMRGSLKTTEKATNTAQFIMTEKGNTLNGYNCGVSSQVTSGDVFFGNWADLIIGFWGGLDVLVDPYTGSLSGTVRLVAHQSMDLAVRHPVSFAHNNDGA